MFNSFIYKYKLKKKLKYKFLEDGRLLGIRTKSISLGYRKHFQYKLYRFFHKKKTAEINKYIIKRLKLYTNYVLKNKQDNTKKYAYLMTIPGLAKHLKENPHRTNLPQRRKFYAILKYKLIKYYRYRYTKRAKMRWWFKKNYPPDILKKNLMKHNNNNKKKGGWVNHAFFNLTEKKKTKRYKKTPLIKNRSLLYKGIFYNYIKFSSIYGFINFNIIKKASKKYKYNYKKGVLYNNFINCRIYIFLYNLMFFSNIKKAYLYIRKYGIHINNFKIYKSTYIIKQYDLILIKEKLKSKILKFLKKNKSFILWLLKNSIYNLIINIKILGFIILFGNINFNLNLQLKLIKKLKTKSNILFTSNYFFKSNFIKRRK